MPYQIVYSSRATGPISAKNLEEILADARVGNKEKHITGALIFVDDVFLQILEGEEAVIRSLLHSISKDSRHSTVKVIYEAGVNEPAFGSWSMAYIAPSAEEVKAWAGFEGADQIDSVVDYIHKHPHNVPDFFVSILDVLAG